MKLSKNNKIFIATALKDKNKNNQYSDLKVASLCRYNSEIVLNLSQKELQNYNLEIDKIENFGDFSSIFLNEENHKKLLSKIIIKSENPFITSMLNLNRSSTTKYFIELVCLNKVELFPEYEFFKLFFDKIHRYNFIYLYYTNKIQEFADIRFTVQVEDLFNKSYLISQFNLDNSPNFDTYFLNKNDFTDRKISINNTTIKEVTEDEKNINANNVSSKLNRSQNREFINTILINENFNNVNLHNQYFDEKLIVKNENNFENENLKTYSYNKNNLFDDNKSENHKNELRTSKTIEGTKNSPKLEIISKQSKNSISVNSNMITDKNQFDLSNVKYEKNELISNNILNEFENIDNKSNTNEKNSENKPSENRLDVSKSLQFDNNIDINLNTKNDEEGFHYAFNTDRNENKEIKSTSPDKKQIILEPEKDIEEINEYDKSKKSRNTSNKNVNEEMEGRELSNKTKSVFITARDIETQNNQNLIAEKNSNENQQKNEDKHNTFHLNKNYEGLQNDENQESLKNDEDKNNIHEEEFKINNPIREAEEENNIKIYSMDIYDNLNTDGKETPKLNCEFNFNQNFINKDFKNITIDKKFIEPNINNNTFFAKKKRDYPEDQIFDINFNVGNYNYLYFDMDFSLQKSMKSTLEKFSSFIKWAWENFKYMKFVIFLPKIQDLYLDLNKDLLIEISEIFSMADILLFEKKELITYKKNFCEIFEKKNFNGSNFHNQNVVIQNSNINNTTFTNTKDINNHRFLKMNHYFEDFFIKDFKIKKRTVPLKIYPTKTLIIIDELNKIIIYEKNYDNKIIFKTENEFILYPQINHTNQNIIEIYKNCLLENYGELRGIYLGAFISKIMQKPVKVDSIVSRDYTGAYMISFELAKKFLKILFNQKPYPLNRDFYIIKLDKVLANSKLAEDLHRRRESKFVLDCVNQKNSYLKFYEPLNDTSLKEFFSIRCVSNTMKNVGFIMNTNGKISEPQKGIRSKNKEESLKIGGKFFIGNNNPKNILTNFANYNLFNSNSVNLINYNTTNQAINIGNKSASNLEKTKFQTFNSYSNINFNNTGNNFAKTCKSLMNKSNKISSLFPGNPLNLPRLITPQVKIDPEEQIKGYLEFEKKLMIN